MMITLMNSLAVLLALALLFAFVWGAWSHTVEQTLGDPLLADPTPATKTKRYFTLVGKVLWNIVSADCYGGWRFCWNLYSYKGETKRDKHETKIDSNGNYWYRTLGRKLVYL